jgi:hypothetical protein
MQKLITTALIIAGFLIAALVAPNYEIKLVEKTASACSDPGCGDD